MALPVVNNYLEVHIEDLFLQGSHSAADKAKFVDSLLKAAQTSGIKWVPCIELKQTTTPQGPLVFCGKFRRYCPSIGRDPKTGQYFWNCGLVNTCEAYATKPPPPQPIAVPPGELPPIPDEPGGESEPTSQTQSVPQTSSSRPAPHPQPRPKDLRQLGPGSFKDLKREAQPTNERVIVLGHQAQLAQLVGPGAVSHQVLYSEKPQVIPKKGQHTGEVKQFAVAEGDEICDPRGGRVRTGGVRVSPGVPSGKAFNSPKKRFLIT